MSQVIGRNANEWFFILSVADMRELVVTRVMGMGSLISCMTCNISYRIVLFMWNMIGCFMYSITSTF